MLSCRVYLYLFYCLCNSCITFNNAARILAVFPVPSISHQVVFRSLTQELARRGHELVIVTPDPAFPKGQTPPNITELDFHDLSYGIWAEEFVKKMDGTKQTSLEQISIGYTTVNKIFEMIINQREFKQIIKSDRKFDLLLVEACTTITLILSHVIKAPLIQISSFGAVPPNYLNMGVLAHPMNTPYFNRQRLYGLTLMEKINAIYEDIKFSDLFKKLEDFENSIAKKYFGSSAPEVKELRKNVDLLMLNIDPIWEGNQAVTPGVIYLGGLHQNPQKDLPKDLQSYLDKSKHGVIYMSFGTNINPSLLPPERMKVFMTVFSKLPYDVLWKWDKDEMEGKPSNVHISKWFPQSDLLRHPKIKLFIMQGGLQSTDEAITAGVPLIGIPMLVDQWYNCEKYVHHGIGLKHLLDEITELELEKSIKTLVEEPSYRRNVERLRSVMRDRPQSPLERAVWWTEYVIRHRGAKHLRSPLANATWTEFLMLDVVFVILLVFLTALLIVYLFCKWVLNRLTPKLKTN